MIKINIKDLEGAALDWLVAKAVKQNINILPSPFDSSYWPVYAGTTRCYQPSASWQQGGPILQEMLSSGKWEITQGLNKGTVCVSNYTDECIPCDHKSWDDDVIHQYSESVLEAAMKAKVAFEMGEEIEIPEELA